MDLIYDFTQNQVESQLSSILNSPAFKSSTILSGFLEFIVAEKLAGREKEIKEYTIGINVLSRNSDFNPQLDAIVRIHAGRLRRALKEFYFENGKNDPIYIEIPKGGYIPVFHSNQNFLHSKNDIKNKPGNGKPIVAVLPFRNISPDQSRDFFADGLGEHLSTDLSRFSNLSVLSYHSARHVAGKTEDIKDTASLLGAQYLLTGSIQSDKKHLQIRVQLIRGSNGEQLWTNSFQESNFAGALFQIQNDIVKNTLTAIGGYYGAIFRDVMETYPEFDGIEKYDAIYWYYHYQKVFTKEVFQKAITALHEAVEADPNYALAWAMLGELYLDDTVNEFHKVENPLEEGLKFALRAVKIDPNCQHGYVALAWIYLFHHNKAECLKSVDRCFAINPNSPDMLGAMGFVLVCAGEDSSGFELLNDCYKLNPYCPWWFQVAYIFHHIQHKEYKEALLWAQKIDRPDLIWDSMMKASVFGHLNQLKEAEENISILKNLLPDAETQTQNIIESFVLSKEIIEGVLDGLKKAGL